MVLTLYENEFQNFLKKKLIFSAQTKFLNCLLIQSSVEDCSNEE